MARTAIATDSNSGITQSQAKELGVFVLPMPFFMRGKIQFEDIDLTQEQFYEILAEDAALDEIAAAKARQQGITVLSTSMPVFEAALKVWQLLNP